MFEEIRPQGYICEFCSDMPNCEDIRSKFGYKMLEEIDLRGHLLFNEIVLPNRRSDEI